MQKEGCNQELYGQRKEAKCECVCDERLSYQSFGSVFTCNNLTVPLNSLAHSPLARSPPELVKFPQAGCSSRDLELLPKSNQTKAGALPSPRALWSEHGGREGRETLSCVRRACLSSLDMNNISL